ncbi:hypothetical protein, partial [Haloferax sp. KTX1]|uniref:hypothetical protein n=1 Tax=Haloferax sp. KTX1 TaxID=2600597 RepID=UPI001C9E6BAD
LSAAVVRNLNTILSTARREQGPSKFTGIARDDWFITANSNPRDHCLDSTNLFPGASKITLNVHGTTRSFAIVWH